ncbi:hypothetical protein [Parapedobacter defluvii]|uniref:hypothetical protein n=1 Tax=Parapedobacter defluvii TaxID=2045106 RepID=UPI000FBBB008|nr:MAG: hypothetical protein EAS52_07920 [Parapedobacter sp.]
MNKFNTYISMAALACLYSSQTIAQPIVDDVEQIALHIQEEVIQSIASIDFVSPSLSFQKEKVIEKVYPVNSSHRLSIDNRYGKISIHNWNRNEVKITITIRTAENSEKRAQDALDRVQIDESTSGNTISLKTNISSSDSNWWSSLTNGGGDRALNIDYEVYMPKRNDLTLANRYGPIELDDRDGKVSLSVSYGSLRAGRLNANDNSLSVAYSKAEIDYLQNGDVSVKYGGFTLSEGEKLTLAISYSGGEIGQINQEADIALRYGAPFKIGLGPAIKKVNVAASYAKVNIEPAAEATFNFNVAVSYGGFDYNQNRVSISNSSEGTTSKSYTGYWNKSTNNSVNISSRYGTVSLK